MTPQLFLHLCMSILLYREIGTCRNDMRGEGNSDLYLKGGSPFLMVYKKRVDFVTIHIHQCF